MTKTKIGHLDELYNFVVENFFILINLLLQNVIWKFSLPSVKKKHSAKKLFAECQKKHSAKSSLPSVKKITLGKEAFLPSAKKNTRQRVCRVFFFGHSAKRLFTECPKKTLGKLLDTRQRAGLRQWHAEIITACEVNNSHQLIAYIYIHTHTSLPSYSTSNPSNICLIPCMHRCMEAITLLPSEVKCLLLQLTQILWDIGGKQIQTIQIATAPRGLVEKNINELVEKTIMNGLSQNNVDWWKQKKTRGSIRW